MAYQFSVFSNTAQDPFAASKWTASQQQGIKDAWAQNQNDPAALRQLMQQTGVSAQDIGNVVGIDPYLVNSTVNPVTGADYRGTNPGGTPVSPSDPSAGMTGVASPYQMPSAGGGMAGGGIGSTTGGGSSQGFTGGNPYLPQMGDALTQQATQAFNRNVMPAIGSQAMATGGYGGSRQGVVEANAMNDLGQNITNGLAGMYGNAYNTGLQYDLGLRNNNLGFANLDNTINNDNNSWALQGANFGLGVNNQLNANAQTGINSGTTIQNTPQTYWNNFSQGANSIGQGYGTSTGSANMPGSPITGMLGGAQLGSQLSNWWGSQPTANSTGGANGAGWGTGAAYGNNDFGSYF